MIEITSEINGQKAVFRFKPMTPAETALWGSKMRSRMAYVEALTRELALMDREPIATRNADTYLAISDRLAAMQGEVVKMAETLADWAVEPAPDAVRKLLAFETTAKPMTEALLQFLSALVPTAAEQKKSSAL
jgi:hypothetical protein